MLFAVSSVTTGLLVNRVQTRWVLLAMGFIWALTQFPTIGSVGFETLVDCRIALRAAEGPTTPVALHFAYKRFPNELRTLSTAVIVQGGAIGVMVALPLLNWVIVRWLNCRRAPRSWRAGRRRSPGRPPSYPRCDCGLT